MGVECLFFTGFCLRTISPRCSGTEIACKYRGTVLNPRTPVLLNLIPNQQFVRIRRSRRAGEERRRSREASAGIQRTPSLSEWVLELGSGSGRGAACSDRIYVYRLLLNLRCTKWKTVGEDFEDLTVRCYELQFFQVNFGRRNLPRRGLILHCTVESSTVAGHRFHPPPLGCCATPPRWRSSSVAVLRCSGVGGWQGRRLRRRCLGVL